MSTTSTTVKATPLPALEIAKKAILDMPIQGKPYTLLYGHVKQAELLFYPANPRIYSAIHKGTIEPTQELMEDHLKGMEHTLELKEDIKLNGGLLEPLLVKEATREVVEGNTRLAAYRLLAKQDPIRWGLVRAYILPADVSDSGISSILSQLHIKGKLNWDPYEKAGHIHRRYRVDKVSLPALAKEMKLSQGSLMNRK